MSSGARPSGQEGGRSAPPPLSRTAWSDERCAREVEAARRKLGGRTCRQALADAGLTVVESDAPARFGGVSLRAVLDLDGRRVTLYTAELRRLDAELERAGWTGPSAADLALAHETFHALAPHLSGPNAERCADLFATTENWGQSTE